jgi:uncharacterized membrane protein HdeD (DUF308 family)
MGAMINGFLLGIIATASLTSGTFFLKFWRQTQDRLFLAFGVAFIIEGINRAAFLFLEAPNEGSVLLYSIRLASFLLVLIAIINKNLR